MALSLLCSVADAQDAVTGLVKMISGSQVSLQYSYVVDDGKTKLDGGGKLLLQGESYLMEGDGLKVWCDGKSRWTVDEAAKEVVVENVVRDDAFMVPVTVIARLHELFVWQSSGERTLFRRSLPESDGVEVAATRYVLTPKDGIKSDVSEAMLYFDSASSLVGGEIKIKGGVSTSFNIYSMDFRPYGDMSPYALSESSFDSSYVVTDLRDL